MCQCGCGETSVERGFKLPSGNVVGYDVYYGCDQCFPGPAISVYVYDTPKSEWLNHAKIEDLTPDEYGGNKGHGIAVSFFEVSDLRAEAKELWKEAHIGRGRDDYRDLDGWLQDYGLRLIQGAMQRFARRHPDV